MTANKVRNDERTCREAAKGSEGPKERARLIGQLHFAFMDTEVASILYVDEVLDGQGLLQYVDSMGSVSGLGRRRDT